MKNMTAKFSGIDGSVLTVYARKGKSGINVAASLKAPGQKAQTGARQSIDTNLDGGFEQAAAAFEALKADSIAKGWTERTRQSGNRSAFTEIPAAPKLADELAPEPKKNGRK